MPETFKKIDCNDNDVVSFSDNYTYKVGKIREALRKSLNVNLGNQLNHELKNKGVNLNVDGHPAKNPPHQHWLQNGIECEILQLGYENWKKGKMKIEVSIEIIIEEENVDDLDNCNSVILPPESPLDDFRRM
ncbi:KGK domain-containing protein [Calothrix sp. 336/3]|uniref:KGK domain-containing protein n=1 Tax=Calothrix sp. 336/3 TaxID=1337936 RepID=UPI0004E461B8|nr:KGK domain-containing protein [Calothrix sp. 336/3]AKG24296.1 hypothetical protein IJ00_25920 [Calothrix sp. 336/3]